MIRRPPRSTRTDTLFPDTTLFRSERFNQCCGYKASHSIADEKSTVQIDEPDVPFNRLAHIDQALTQNTAQQTAREGRRDQLFAALHENSGKAAFRQKALLIDHKHFKCAAPDRKSTRLNSSH